MSGSWTVPIPLPSPGAPIQAGKLRSCWGRGSGHTQVRTRESLGGAGLEQGTGRSGPCLLSCPGPEYSMESGHFSGPHWLTGLWLCRVSVEGRQVPTRLCPASRGAPAGRGAGIRQGDRDPAASTPAGWPSARRCGCLCCRGVRGYVSPPLPGWTLTTGHLATVRLGGPGWRAGLASRSNVSCTSTAPRREAAAAWRQDPSLSPPRPGGHRTCSLPPQQQGLSPRPSAAAAVTGH